MIVTVLLGVEALMSIEHAFSASALHLIQEHVLLREVLPFLLGLWTPLTISGYRTATRIAISIKLTLSSAKTTVAAYLLMV